MIERSIQLDPAYDDPMDAVFGRSITVNDVRDPLVMLFNDIPPKWVIDTNQCLGEISFSDPDEYYIIFKFDHKPQADLAVYTGCVADKEYFITRHMCQDV